MKWQLIGCICLAVSISACTVNSAITGVSLAYDHRQIEQTLETSILETKMKDALSQHRDIRHASINLQVYKDMALLTGRAPNEKVKMHAEKICARFISKKHLYNQIQIGPNFTQNENLADAVLTSKVVTRFLVSKEVHPSDIKVITSAGTVYLMGIMPKATADFAVSYTRKIQGVLHVVRVMQYVYLMKD